MTVTFFRPYKNIIKQILSSYTTRSVKLIRSVSVMEINKKETKDNVKSKGFTRFKKGAIKRQWEDADPKKTENGETDSKKLCGNTERVKLKKMAMLLGYCGVDYYGMQRNPGVRTIEEDLLKALLEAKYIKEDAFENQQVINFQRSSRTDKGVSAARQVVSLKLPLELDIKEINKHLPECIKVFGVRRVTNKFNSKLKCNARTYSYTLPTYTFEPSLVTIEERKRYRIPEDKLEQVKQVLEVYKGTKNYHNFTEKKLSTDPSALRHMISFTVERVFVELDMEFAVLSVKGQSFMIHQIRKMVAMTVAVLRGLADMSLLIKALSKEKVMTPIAPGLGLVLDMVHYEMYNTKFQGSHDSLTWDEEESDVQKFKEKYIYPIIVKGEIENDSMGSWLEKLNCHSYEPTEHVPEKTDEKELLVEDDDDDAADANCDNDDVITKSDHTNNKNVDTSSLSDVTCTESKSV